MKKLAFSNFIFALVAVLLIASCKKNDDDDNSVSTTSTVDTELPIIELTGPTRIVLARNSKYMEPGVKAIDNEDGDISDQIIAISDLDSSEFGLYNIIYTVSDKAGNNAIPVVRNVEVIIGRDDFLGAYNVSLDENCPSTTQLNSPQEVSAGVGENDIIFNNFLPIIGGVVPAKINGSNIDLVPTTLQSFLNISGNGTIDVDGKVMTINLTIENTLPIIGGVDNCIATYTKL